MLVGDLTVDPDLGSCWIIYVEFSRLCDDCADATDALWMVISEQLHLSIFAVKTLGKFNVVELHLAAVVYDKMSCNIWISELEAQNGSEDSEPIRKEESRLLVDSCSQIFKDSVSLVPGIVKMQGPNFHTAEYVQESVKPTFPLGKAGVSLFSKPV